MAAVAQIQIVVDDGQLALLGSAAQMAGRLIKDGLTLDEVTTGMKNLDYTAKETADALQELGVSAQTAGPAIASAGKEAVAFQDSMMGMRMTAALAGEEIGIRLPRALTSVAAHSTTLGPLLSAAFPIIAAVAFIDIAGRVGEKIAELSSKAFDLDGAWAALEQTEKALNSTMLQQIANTERLANAYALLGLTGVARAREELLQSEQAAIKAGNAYIAAQKDLERYQQQADKERATPNEVYDAGTGQSTYFPGQVSPETQKAVDDQKKNVEQLKIALDDANYAAAAMGQSYKDAVGTDAQKQTRDLNQQIDGILKSLDQVGAGSKAAFGQLVGLIQSDAPKVIDAFQQIQNKYDAQRGQAQGILDDYGSAYPKIASMAEQAFAAINAAQQRDVVEATLHAIDQTMSAEEKEYNAGIKGAQKESEDIQRFTDQTVDIQERAAEASVPPWEQAYAKINATMVKEIQQAEDQIQKLEQQHVITTEQGEELLAQRVAAIQVQAQQEAIDKMAGQLQQFWDAITSGHLGQYFLKQFETLVFRMVATWILGISQMQQATQGGLFGSLFGAGGGLGAGGGTGGGLLGMLGLSGVFGGASSGAGASGASGNFDFLQGNSADVITAAGGLSSTGSVAAPGAGSLIGGLAGGSGLASLLGPAGLILGGALTLGSSSSSLSSALSGGMLGAGIGGVIGLGLSAALAPFTLGLSLLAGGALGALFGGLFGSDAHSQGQKLRTQARSQIDSIVQSYDSHQTDYNSAMSELESLQQQTQKQLSQLGDNTNMPAFQTAEQQIQQTETQRQQRSSVTFGPAEFETGGLVGPLGIPWHAAVPYFAAADSGRIPSFASGGAVPIIAHAGEYVMSRPAVERIGTNKLAAMNAGASGDTHVHFNVSTMDARSFHDFLERGGGKVVLRHLRREVSEGR